MKCGVLLLGLLCASFANAKTAPLSHEASLQVFSQVRTSICDVLKIDAPKIKRLPHPGPVTREEFINELNSWFELSKPKFRAKPVGLPINKELIEARNPNQATRDTLMKLVKWGFVAPVGPVVSGPENTLTAKQAGEAIGMFLSRLAEVTHVWDPKFSPDSMRMR